MDLRKKLLAMTMVMVLLFSVTGFADWGDYDMTYTPYYSTDEYTVTAGESLYVVLCDVSVSLRYYPSMDADVITQVPLGSRVTFLSDVGNGYLLVDYNGLQGYILSYYLDYYEPQNYAGDYGWIVNVNYSASLRSLPTADSYAYLQIPADAMVTNIVDVNDDFYQVTYNGITGYVLKYLVYTGY